MPPSPTLWPAKNGGTSRATPPGHTVWAVPSRSTNSPTVTVSETVTEASVRWRIIVRSSSAPNSGANTSTTSTADSAIGRPHGTTSCQNRNALTMPTAPCAMLNTFEVA